MIVAVCLLLSVWNDIGAMATQELEKREPRTTLDFSLQVRQKIPKGLCILLLRR
jgi:hypothetical protein